MPQARVTGYEARPVFISLLSQCATTAVMDVDILLTLMLSVVLTACQKNDTQLLTSVSGSGAARMQGDPSVSARKSTQTLTVHTLRSSQLLESETIYQTVMATELTASDQVSGSAINASVKAEESRWNMDMSLITISSFTEGIAPSSASLLDRYQTTFNLNFIDSSSVINSAFSINGASVMNSAFATDIASVINSVSSDINSASAINSESAINRESAINSQSAINRESAINSQSVISSQSVIDSASSNNIVSSAIDSSSSINSAPAINSASAINSALAITSASAINWNSSINIESAVVSSSSTNSASSVNSVSAINSVFASPTDSDADKVSISVSASAIDNISETSQVQFSPPVTVLSNDFQWVSSEAGNPSRTPSLPALTPPSHSLSTGADAIQPTVADFVSESKTILIFSSTSEFVELPESTTLRTNSSDFTLPATMKTVPDTETSSSIPASQSLASSFSTVFSYTTILQTNNIQTTIVNDSTTNDYRVIMDFNGKCERLKKNDYLRLAFISKLIEQLSLKMNVSAGNFETDRFFCDPMQAQLQVSKLNQEHLNAISGMKENMTISVSDGNALLPFHVLAVRFIKETDASVFDIDSFESVIEMTDIVLISVSSFVFLLLIMLCIIYTCRECLVKKRGHTFSVIDIPHVNLKLADFSLTKIPRPQMVYHADGDTRPTTASESLYRAGRRPHIPPRWSAQDPTPQEHRLSVNAEDIQVRMADRDGGLVIGVTSKACQLIALNGHSTAGNESLSRKLLKPEYHQGPLEGVDNPNCSTLDESSNSNKEYKEDENSELELML
ncbi:hypothetical protein MAR_025418 [Mya arenaria]|uniref:Uncharacterized protein n=1 Tax=Mya arenaria TaxID=6604 RepID=A0ABY7E1K4_MYAAR|nr:hypothetical protein MAR_025418 [Mya arenaria]